MYGTTDLCSCPGAIDSNPDSGTGIPCRNLQARFIGLLGEKFLFICGFFFLKLLHPESGRFFISIAF